MENVALTQSAIYGILCIAIGIIVIMGCLLLPMAQKADDNKRKLGGLEGLQEETAKKLNKRAKKTKSDSGNIFEVAEKINTMNGKSQGYVKKSISEMNDTERMIYAAGLKISPSTLSAMQLIFAVLMAAQGFIIIQMIDLGSTELLIPLMMAILGYIMPKFMIQNMGKKRKDKLIASLSSFLDLLVICVEAGLGYDAAIDQIYEKDKSLAATELAITVQEINNGVSRSDAYKALQRRCDAKEMTAFANSVVQAEMLGVPIANVLKTQAEILRENRRLATEAKIEAAPVKMTIPLVLCIFPAIFIVLLGPAACNVIDMFAQMNF